ncbi:flagellin, partial [Hydrogenophaga sp.]|uniref:flagellin n=1 Tax=Hydrogenophaga sp. TaxID=1904254 RepID=UPI00356AC393
QRVRELAVQSANATNSTTDRAALQAEAVQLKEEIGRVASQTQFNGTKLLDGSFTSKSFQVGANQGQTITLGSVANINLNALGTLQTSAGGATTYATTVTGIGQDAGPHLSHGLTPGELVINGVDIGDWGSPPGEGATDVASKGAEIADAINLHTGTTGVTAVADGTTGAITLTSSDAAGIDITSPGGLGVEHSGLSVGNTPATASLSVAGSETGIANLSLASAEQASWAIAAIDSALSQVNGFRGTLGAIQSRFENAISTIQVTSENLSAARGRIVDADFAMETANLSRAQILQQAGTAMVAQANQLPQGVLSLLR